jgi:putative membrane protein
MKNYFIKLLISTLLILIISYFLKIEITNYLAAVFMAVALSFLNTFLKPILKILAIPVTIMSLGLFLLVINASIVKIADYFIDGIQMTFLQALFFSVILSVSQYILNKIFTEKKQ